MAPVLRGDTATTAFQGYRPSLAPVQPRTRVWGSDQPLEAASGWSSTSSPRTRWASTCTYGELAPVRPIVTNLRLPGQYDERLLGPLGLQGPYYNWNRWYLPGVGRYLEPDPLALRGKMNGFWAPDWYGYANQNPLRFTDFTGLAVWLCKRTADLPLNPGLKHHWLVTGPGPLEPVCKPRPAGGMGKCGAGAPGHGGSDSPFVTQTCMNDHSNEDIAGPGVTCELVEDIDEQCVNAEIQTCHSLGRWEP